MVTGWRVIDRVETLSDDRCIRFDVSPGPATLETTTQGEKHNPFVGHSSV